MSRIVERWNSIDDVDVIWKICTITELCIVCITIFLLVRTLQHLHCVPYFTRNQIQPVRFKMYSSLCAICATTTATISFADSIICAQLNCWSTDRAYIIEMTLFTSYTLAKLFLYFLFIGRLFNVHYARLYHYHRNIQYLLWAFLAGLLMATLVIDCGDLLLRRGIGYPFFIDVVSLALYGITDLILSTSCMILFFRPICSPIASGYMSVEERYRFISVIQFIAAALYQLSLFGEIYLDIKGASRRVYKVRGNIARLVRMMDCLLLIICIYHGFARKRTVCISIIRKKYLVATIKLCQL